MALFLRVYFNAVFGGLGGLLGWMLFGVFGDKSSSSPAQQILGGALIGGFIGYLVVGVDAIRDGSFLRFCRLATYGVVIVVLAFVATLAAYLPARRAAATDPLIAMREV